MLSIIPSKHHLLGGETHPRPESQAGSQEGKVRCYEKNSTKPATLPLLGGDRGVGETVLE